MDLKDKNQKALLIFVFAALFLTIGLVVFSQFYDGGTSKEADTTEETKVTPTEEAEVTYNGQETTNEAEDSKPRNLRCTVEDFAIKLTWEAPKKEAEFTYNIYFPNPVRGCFDYISKSFLTSF